MDYRNLGRSGLKVSPLCLGTMMFGGQTDEPTSGRIVAMSREAGLNFIDTADVYNEGRSEEVVGRAIKRRIGTGGCWRPRPATRWARARTTAACRGSWLDARLRRQPAPPRHRPHRRLLPPQGGPRRRRSRRRCGPRRPAAPGQDPLRRPLQLPRLARRRGLPPVRSGGDRPAVSQPYYNLINRMPEVEHLPACAHYGLGVAPYSPLARGVLTGKYEPDAAPPRARAPRGRTGA